MLAPSWVVALAFLSACSSEASGQCWAQERCKDLSSENSIMECIQLCKSELTAEAPVFPGEGHLQPPSEAERSAVEAEQGPGAPREEKRSYSMEHFRWGKPVGRKRRPVKVFPNGVEEESAEAYPSEKRREALGDSDYALEEGDPSLTAQEKKDGSYKMNHFRWSGPPASKRYGGFMKSWDERSQKPLLTLFKNVIVKDGHQKKAE
ncbi:proopiomelanocortin a [Megalops cyprinoides]|uniref:proopiomelanocortin a n=1 Tax=Megalops cyprinoides TaxID=118141 RepID=UPI001864AE8B|nr:proopiomelanocortin a [Megalops cyprinoides]